MLDTPYSLKHMNSDPDGWLSPSALTRVNYDHFICDQSKPHYGFKSWHDWFDREIHEWARPFDKKAENVIINNSEHYPNFNMPVPDVKWQDRFWLKDQNYSLCEIFGADKLPEAQQKYFRDIFEGGTVYQGFLNPWCYHRWRSPVSGVIEKCYKVGNSYYAGNPSLSFHLAESYIASQPLLTMTSVRQIYVIKADNPNIGRVAVIEIGMAEVSGIVNLVKEGDRIEKGALLGMFRFGGSSHAFVFDRNAKNLRFDDSIAQRRLNPTTGVEESLIQLVRTPLAYVD
uniref:Phosphatidylserine decarboxylase proenzyme 3 n=1 Tax=Noccaea caerulescens TaxID=107243 RepID=A0A1J3CBH7_NOCCA